MKKTNLFAPANATHPIQDNLGQIIMAAGLTKLEYASILIAGHIYNTSKGDILPETIAEESITLATEILDQCEQKFEQSQKTTIIK